MSGKLTYLLQKHWGYTDFRANQKEAIESVLAGNDTIVLFPTGGGKSLVYQLSGIVLPHLTVVISPLISLIKDQLQELRSRSIIADYITAARSEDDVVRIFENVLYGNTKFLFVSPERFRSKLFVRKLKKVQVDLFAIDEAHCLSTWGHDFRPAYLELVKLRETFKHSTILCLTATATGKVLNDIQQVLKLQSVNIFRESFRRDNIAITIDHSEDKNARLLALVKKNYGSTIIYSRTRKSSEKLSHLLREHGIPNKFYHAGLSNKERDQVQTAWFRNNPSIIIATTAFGMGINKPDVRLIIHDSIPSRLEDYYQEIGRAGRDGNRSDAVLFFNDQDIQNLHYHLETSYPDKALIAKIYQGIYKFFRIAYEEGRNRSYIFDYLELCRFLKIKAGELYSVLKILERDGYLKFDHSRKREASLKFIIDRKGLNSLSKHPKMDALVKYLLRSYDGLFFSFVKIDEDSIAKVHNLTIQELRKALTNLSKMNVLKFNPAQKGSQLNFYKNRKPDHMFSISRGAYEDKKNFDQKQMKNMFSFLGNDTLCRQSIILSYFGEKNDHTCGICDNCRNNTKNSTDSIESRLWQKIDQETYGLKELIDSFESQYQREIRKILHRYEDEGRIQIDEHMIVKKLPGNHS